MIAREIIHSLEVCGYTLTVVDGKVRGDRHDLLPPPPEFPALLEALRQRKGEVIDELMRRAFTEVPPSKGGLYETVFPASDEGQVKRWAVAVETGLIHLVGKVRVGRRSGQCRISYRCAMPPEWLEDAVEARLCL